MNTRNDGGDDQTTDVPKDIAEDLPNLASHRLQRMIRFRMSKVRYSIIKMTAFSAKRDTYFM